MTVARYVKLAAACAFAAGPLCAAERPGTPDEATLARPLSATAIRLAQSSKLEARTAFDIPAQPLGASLKQVADQAGIQILFEERIVSGINAPEIRANQSALQTLQALLEGTDLELTAKNETVAVRERGRASLRTTGVGDLAPLASGSIRIAQNDPAAQGDFLVASHEEDAQNSEADQKDKLEEVVVQGAKRKFAPTDSSAATKLPMEIVKTPQSITVLTSELLSIVGSKNINDAVALAPGVVNTSGEIPDFSSFSVRGFDEAEPYNSVKINGLSVLALGVYDLSAFDRVEVVRGPASVIYGQVNYGGSVNMVLKKPQAKRAFSGEMGTDSRGGVNFISDITGSLREDESLRGRLIVSYDDFRTSQDLAYAKTTTFAPSVSWDITDDDTLDINYFHTTREARNSYGFSLTDQNTLPDISKSAFLTSDRALQQRTTSFLTTKLTHRFDSGWLLTGAAEKSTGPQSLRQPWIYGRSSAATGDVPYYDYWFADRASEHQGDLALSGDFNAFGRSHTLLLTANSRYVDRRVWGACCDVIGTQNVYDWDPFYMPVDPYGQVPKEPWLNPVPPAGANWYDYGRSTYREMSGGALLLLHPLERVSLMLGANRLHAKTLTGQSFSYGADNPATIISGNATTKRAGLVYEFANGLNLYGSYSDAVIFTALKDHPGGSVLPPERGVQFEAGAKMALFDKRLTVGSSVFQIDREDVAVGDPAFPNQPYFLTVGGQKHKGVELEAIGEPIPGWNILTSYSFLDISVDMPGNPLGWNGHSPPNTPRNQFKLYTTYQLQSGPLHGLSFGGGLFHIGERSVDFLDTYHFPAYTRLDLRIAYDAFEHTSYSLAAVNVTNEKILAAYGGDSSSGIDYQARPMVFFRVDFKY